MAARLGAAFNGVLVSGSNCEPLAAAESRSGGRNRREHTRKTDVPIRCRAVPCARSPEWMWTTGAIIARPVDGLQFATTVQ